jgi:hypothetical protein
MRGIAHFLSAMKRSWQRRNRRGATGGIGGVLFQVQPLLEILDAVLQFLDPRNQLIAVPNLFGRILARIAARFHKWMRVWRVQPQFLGFEPGKFLFRLTEFFGNFWIGCGHGITSSVL